MDHQMLSVLWYVVLGCSVTFYTILDGFDLGVGGLHLFARNDYERRVFLNAIGPVWDGNEVWLVVIIGALFAGFPEAYATIFSGFYTLLMIMIAGLMLRAVAIEFRSKKQQKKWRQFWDGVFSVSSIVLAFIFGVGIANLIQGVPLNSDFEYLGNFSDLFTFYTMLVGVTVIALFAMHGSIYLLMKTEGDLRNYLYRRSQIAIGVFVTLYIGTTIHTLLTMPHMTITMYQYPVLFCIPLTAFFTILLIWYSMYKNRDGWAFVFSCASIFMLVIVYGIGTFPYLVFSSLNPQTNSLTVFNASSSSLTLSILLIIALIGVPLVLAYGYWVYSVFGGKVKIDDQSY